MSFSATTRKCFEVVGSEGIKCAWMISCRVYSFFPSSVDPEEIKRLGKRFKKLDLDNSGSLSVDEFMKLPELQQNPLVQRVIDIFDTDGNGEVDFKGQCHPPPLPSPDSQFMSLQCLRIRRCCGCFFFFFWRNVHRFSEFILGISQFSVKGDRVKKLRCKNC